MEEFYKRQLEEFKVENSILWKALRDIMWNAKSLEDAKAIANKADLDLCPFMPLIKADEAKAMETKEVAA